jgi:hypothetical protein
MSITQIRGSSQVKDITLTRNKLRLDFLEGSDLDVTNSANNATITGLRDGSNPRDAATYAQLVDLETRLAAALIYRGTLAAGADVSGNATGNAYMDATDGLKAGDLFIINGNGNITDGTNNLAVNTGDHLIANKDVADDATIDVLNDFDKIDNTEAADIIRTGDVIDNLNSTVTDNPLSANQGRALNVRLTAVEAFGIPVYNETPAVTGGSAVVNLANTPVLGSQQVYLNGLRMAPGSGNDYTISGGVITFTFTLAADDTVLVDYKR